MPKCIHLICRRREDNSGFNGISHIGGKMWRSVAWELSEEDANALIDGWVYFHQTKAALSHFGGKVIRIETTESFTAHGRPEIAIIFNYRTQDALRQRWRGASHGMAWTGGLVDPSLPHEMEPAHA